MYAHVKYMLNCVYGSMCAVWVFFCVCQDVGLVCVVFVVHVMHNMHVVDVH